MIVRDLAAAEADLDEALAHYASIEKELAAGLLREVVSAKEVISRFPLAWRHLGGGMRSYALHRFPYNVIYRAGDEEILIVAYAHSKGVRATGRSAYSEGRCADRLPPCSFPPSCACGSNAATASSV